MENAGLDFNVPIKRLDSKSDFCNSDADPRQAAVTHFKSGGSTGNDDKSKFRYVIKALSPPWKHKTSTEMMGGGGKSYPVKTNQIISCWREFVPSSKMQKWPLE